MTIHARWPLSIAAALLAWPGLAARADEPPPGSGQAIERALVEAVAKSEKSVVAIARVRRERPRDAAMIESRPDAFGRRPSNPLSVRPERTEFLPQDYSAGVVFDDRGHIVTGYAIVADDCDYFVTTQARKTYRAWIQGADPRSDLAVLSVDAKDLQPIALGAGGQLKKGQLVAALGNPVAIARDGQTSVGYGIVANLGRKAPPDPDDTDSVGKRTLHHFGTLIQTDARLNVGTTGGALVNLKGQMVGMIVAPVAPAGYEAAAGYAIPVDATFRRAIDAMKQGHEVEYGMLGVQPQELRPEDLAIGLRGTRAGRVVMGGPAARAGIKVGDVIATVDGAPIYDADGLFLEVGRLPPESVVRLGVTRDGRQRTFEATLVKYPVKGKPVVTQPAPAWRGIRVDYATMLIEMDVRTRIGMTVPDDAVVVVDVAEDSPAYKAGVRRGMLITHAAGTAVRTPKEFRTAVAGKTKDVVLRITGEGEKRVSP